MHTPEEIQEFKEKAEKWDALDEKIAKFYVDDEGNELPEDENDTGLLGIGEVAALAFGWL